MSNDFEDTMGKALEALHIVAKSLQKIKGIEDVSVDNDHKSGEILFRVGTDEYCLKLEQI